MFGSRTIDQLLPLLIEWRHLVRHVHIDIVLYDTAAPLTSALPLCVPLCVL